MANVVVIRESMEASGGSAEATGEPREALGRSLEASGGLTEGWQLHRSHRMADRGSRCTGRHC